MPSSLNNEIQPVRSFCSAVSVRFVSVENELDGFPLNQRDLFILVRPDRYIYGVFKEEDANAFASTFQKNLLDLIHTQK